MGATAWNWNGNHGNLVWLISTGMREPATYQCVDGTVCDYVASCNSMAELRYMQGDELFRKESYNATLSSVNKKNKSKKKPRS